MAETIFITGATGNIGAKIVGHILDRERSAKLILLVRGKSDIEARRRFEKTLAKIHPTANMNDVRSRVEVIAGDITGRNLGMDTDRLDTIASKVTHIIHAAAVTRFDQPLETARTVNLGGTMNVMRFAQMVHGYGRLRCIAHISTAFICGEQKGVVYEEDPADEPSFSNSYERSKWETERYLKKLMPRLPIIIFRPSIVVGDSVTGRINLFNVLYTPLRYICRGDLPLIPCRPRTALDVVPVDYVARAICYIAMHSNNGAGRIFHITAGAERSAGIEYYISHAIEFVGRTFPAVTPASPRYINRRLFHAVMRLLPIFQGRTKKLQRLMSIYEPYISIDRTFDDRNTAEALRGTGIRPPHPAEYLENVLNYWIRTAHVLRYNPAV